MEFLVENLAIIVDWDEYKNGYFFSFFVSNIFSEKFNVFIITLYAIIAPWARKHDERGRWSYLFPYPKIIIGLVK